MAYWHTIARAGASWTARALAAGAAGLVIADLPATTAASWTRTARAEGLHTILLAGSADPEDLAVTARFASGAVYVPAAFGPTGTGRNLDPALPRRIALAREATGLHVVTGIGVTDPDRARAAAEAGASAVIVGSELTRAASGPDPAVDVAAVAAQFAAAMGAAPGQVPHTAPRGKRNWTAAGHRRLRR